MRRNGVGRCRALWWRAAAAAAGSWTAWHALRGRQGGMGKWGRGGRPMRKATPRVDKNSLLPLIGRVAHTPNRSPRASAASSRYFTRTSRRLGTLHHTSGDSPSRPCKDAADSRNPEMDLPCIASFARESPFVLCWPALPSAVPTLPAVRHTALQIIR